MKNRNRGMRERERRHYQHEGDTRYDNVCYYSQPTLHSSFIIKKKNQIKFFSEALMWFIIFICLIAEPLLEQDNDGL